VNTLLLLLLLLISWYRQLNLLRLFQDFPLCVSFVFITQVVSMVFRQSVYPDDSFEVSALVVSEVLTAAEIDKVLSSSPRISHLKILGFHFAIFAIIIRVCCPTSEVADGKKGGC
jgi:hypothetical protein